MSRPDVLHTVLGIEPGSPTAELRERRPEVLRHTQGSYEALITPSEPGALSHHERALLALRTAVGAGVAPLTRHYREAAHALGATEAELAAAQAPVPDGLPRRTAALLAHADLLGDAPGDARPVHLERLSDAGLGPRETVAASQLISYVHYQARTAAGLAALLAEATDGGTGTGAGERREEAPGTAGNEPRPGGELGFTLEPLDWAAWLETVDPATADARQLAVLDESLPTARTSPYYLTLIHDVDALRERSRLYNKIMYAPRGLARTDREIAALATSRINGCVYCASVHARRFVQLAKGEEKPARVLLDQGIGHEDTDRRRAIVTLTEALTRRPGTLGPADLAPLRAVGLDGLDILDLIHVVAVFAWANRLMLTLGEPVPVPPQATEPEAGKKDR